MNNNAHELNKKKRNEIKKNLYHIARALQSHMCMVVRRTFDRVRSNSSFRHLLTWKSNARSDCVLCAFAILIGKRIWLNFPCVELHIRMALRKESIVLHQFVYGKKVHIIWIGMAVSDCLFFHLIQLNEMAIELFSFSTKQTHNMFACMNISLRIPSTHSNLIEKYSINRIIATCCKLQFISNKNSCLDAEMCDK